MSKETQDGTFRPRKPTWGLLPAREATQQGRIAADSTDLARQAGLGRHDGFARHAGSAKQDGSRGGLA